ncbi:MAG: hypothetical protein ACRELX_06010 [Longimicrobiales bacterium]
MDTVAETQRALNRTSAERWQLFADHRARVTDLALSAIRVHDTRICVLGAGNCNDLDLRRIAGAGARIHLVDIDGDALERAIQRQGMTTGDDFVLHPGIDVSGVAPMLDAARNGGADIDALILAADAPRTLELPGAFDLVISSGVLTQLVRAAAGALGEDHARLDDVAIALRAGHFRTLVDLLRPGGRALLVTEVASSESLPGMALANDDALGALLLRAIATGQLFMATNPAAMLHWLGAARPAGARLAAPGLVGPWRWQLSPRLQLLVVGLLLRRPVSP